MNNNRDKSIDILRCLGTFSVIFAHMKLPSVLNELRSFDVVLLVFISGVSYSLSTKKTYVDYVRRRVKKLIVPTYFVLIIIFLSAYFLCFITNRQQLFSSSDIFLSFCLSNYGIGYVWIVKVYLIIALLSPFLNYCCEHIKNEFFFILITILAYLINSLLYCFNISNSKLFIDYILYVIPYSLVMMLGIRWNRIDSTYKIIYLIISAVIIIIISLNLEEFTPNQFKYPPRLLYLSYGLFVSIICLSIFKKISSFIISPLIKHYISYISKNSFILYLIHIVVLFSYNYIVDVVGYSFLYNFAIQYVIVLTLSLLLLKILPKQLKFQ